MEVCVNNVWGTVCGSSGNWRSIEARVACRQAGFSSNGAVTVSTFGPGNGSAYDISCTGSETALSSCQVTPVPNCASNNAGIRCQQCKSTRIVSLHVALHLFSGPGNLQNAPEHDPSIPLFLHF